MHLRCTYVLFIFLLFSFAGLLAQTGAIQGIVFDTENNEYLPGANVILKGQTVGTSSDRDGFFRIDNVKPGVYALEISYIGYESFTDEITVKAGEKTQVKAGLKPTYMEGETVVVYGQSFGQARALNQQKTADNIVNIVASEQMGRFPDPNSAEAIQRLPGISVQRDQGEGRYVVLRGTAPRLSNVTINGAQIPSPEGDDRFVALDVIPADQLAALEVTKSITPEMDGEAIGGTVNLVTRSAFDYPKPTLKITLAPGYNNLMEDFNYQGAFSYGRRFTEDGKLGILVSGSYYRTNRGSDNNEMEWGDEEFNGTDRKVLEALEIRDYEVIRDRIGLSSTIDYKLSENSSFFFRGTYNRYSDSENRRRLLFDFSDGDYQSQNQVEQFVAERELKDRYEVQDIYSVRAGGEHHFNKLAVDYSLSYSYAQEDEPDRHDIVFEMEDLNGSYNMSNPNTPTWNITSGQDIYDPASFEFNELVIENNLTTDQNLTGGLNIAYPYLLGGNRGELKFGLKYRQKQKDRNNKVEIYDWDGADDLTMDRLVGDFEDEDFQDGKYKIGLSPEPDKVKDFFDNNRSDFELEFDDTREDSDAEDFEASEDVIAGYIQSRYDIDNLRLLGGVRIEQTNIDYTGYEVQFDTAGDYASTGKVSETNDYMHVLPMIHARYRLGANTNLRAAWTNSIARPNYFDLVPYRLINREDEEMEIGNVALDATESMNTDLMFEHYLESLGIISAGIFHKNITNYIFIQQYEISGGEYDGYEVEQPVNAGDAQLFGIELSLQRRFHCLPGFLNGLGIYANYTYTWSETEIDGRDDKISLPGQAKHTGNFALSYEKYRFSGRVALNWHGEYISEVGEEAMDDVYYRDHFQVDVSAGYQIMPNLSIFAEFINLNNEPLRYYMGESSRPIQREFYSWWSHLGVKWEM